MGAKTERKNAMPFLIKLCIVGFVTMIALFFLGFDVNGPFARIFGSICAIPALVYFIFWPEDARVLKFAYGGSEPNEDGGFSTIFDVEFSTGGTKAIRVHALARSQSRLSAEDVKKMIKYNTDRKKVIEGAEHARFLLGFHYDYEYDDENVKVFYSMPPKL